MLTFVLERNAGTEVIYRYFPEGKKESGLISYDKNQGKLTIIQLPDCDEYKHYALHMFARIIEYAKEGNFKESGMIAWY